MHLLFHFEHLDFFDHGVELIDQVFLFLEIESLLSDTYLACFDLLHHLDLFIGIYYDLRILLIYLGFAYEQGLIKLWHWFLMIYLHLTLLDSNLYLKVRFCLLQVRLDDIQFIFLLPQR